jgi:hypothetical protein
LDLDVAKFPNFIVIITHDITNFVDQFPGDNVIYNQCCKRFFVDPFGGKPATVMKSNPCFVQMHDQSPNKPEKTTIANPPMVTIANDKNAGPIFKANPSAPMAKRTTPPVQTNPIKIFCSMINPKK